MWQLRMHCNLRPPDSASIVLHFNWEAFAKFEVGQRSTCSLLSYSILISDTLRYAVTLNIDLLTLKFDSTSGVTCSKSVRSLSEIEQSPAAELLII